MKIVKILSITLALLVTAAMFGVLPAPAASKSNRARVTYLRGTAYKSKNKAGLGARLKQNYSVYAGYYVKTGAKSRLELTMPDGSKIRLASKSVLFLSSARFRNRTRNYETRLVSGKVYTKARPSSRKNDRFVVRSGGAVAGIRGTSFNTILMPDGATRVKCFEGKVWVANFSDYTQRILREGKQEIPTEGPIDAPVVPGPEVVTEEEWVRIASAMMSVTVGADGTVQDPQQFSQDDTDDWEDWNRKRDTR